MLHDVNTALHPALSVTLQTPAELQHQGWGEAENTKLKTDFEKETLTIKHRKKS